MYVIKVTEFKFEVIFGLQGCLEAVVASEPAKRTHTIAVLIVDAGLWGHCPLVSFKVPLSSDDTLVLLSEENYEIS